MNNRMRNRTTFHPSLAEATLENRLVLSSAGTFVPPTPPPAPPPVYSDVVILKPTSLAIARQLRTDYTRQVQLATLDLRNAVALEIRQLYANGSVPTSQLLNDFDASVHGTIDATALRLSSQASLLPGSGARLVPAVQNALLGSSSNTLSSVLSSALQSSRDTGSALRLQSIVARDIDSLPNQINPQFNSYFNTTNLNQAAVNGSGQEIPLAQFMAGRVVSQLGDTLGTLAQSFPNVANSVLFPNGSTTNPTQQLFDQFGVQVRSALSTAALQLGSSLAVFPGSSSVIAQIAPDLLGSSTSSGTNSLASALQSVPFGSTNFDTAVGGVFNRSFDNFLGPVTSFLGMRGQSNLTLPTNGLTSPFSSQFSGSSFSSGFNNGFAADTTVGFVGFGVAPSVFDADFSTGFNNTVSSVIQSLGFVNTPLGTTGTVGGVPVQSR